MDAPLDILYQDDYLVAVDKPPGQLVHPADVPQPGDEVTMKILRDQLGQLVYNVHRLDRPTTGVLLFALSKGVSRAMNRAFERHQVQKTYHAVVEGKPPAESWQCHEPLQKNEGDPFREARTDSRLLESGSVDSRIFSLLEAVPHSGRYHQIRRHLASAGFPIVGDFRYGGIERGERLGKSLGTGSRMLLQAKSLAFRHPETGADLVIEAPAAAEIERLVAGFGRHVPEEAKWKK